MDVETWATYNAVMGAGQSATESARTAGEARGCAFWPKDGGTPLLVIALVALAVRVWGFWFGLPYLYNPDEHLTVNTALSFGSGDLNPHDFKHGSLPMYVLFAGYALFFAVGRVLGVFHSSHAFAVSFVNDPTAWYLIGRGMTVIYGVGAVLVLYRIGALLAGKTGGLVAAKFTGAVLVIPVLLTAVAGSRQEPEKLPAARTALLSLGVMVLTYLCASPYSLLDYRTFAGDVLGFQRLFNMSGQWGAFGIANQLASDLLRAGVGVAGVLLAAAGLLPAGTRPGRTHLPLLAFGIVYAAVLLTQHRYQPNWSLPLMIPVCALAGAGGAWVLQRTRAPVFALLAVAIAQPLVVAARADRRLTTPDTRTLAKQWMERNLPPGAVVVLDGGEGGDFPQLRESRRSLEARKRAALRDPGGRYKHLVTYYDLKIQALGLYRGRVFDTLRLKHAWWKSRERTNVEGAPDTPGFERAHYDLDYYTRHGAQYLATSSQVVRRYHSQAARRQFPAAYKFYDRLWKQAAPIAHFKPGKRARGPEVFVFRLPAFHADRE